MSTLVRFEVWESDNGETSHWQPVRGGVFESAHTARLFAQKRCCQAQAVVVERWNVGTNTFIDSEDVK